MDEIFATERPRLVRIANHVLGDHAEAEDVVQTTWLRLHDTDTEIHDLPGWLTTRIEGHDAVAGFFDGAAKAALPVFVDERPGGRVVRPWHGPTGLRLHRGRRPRAANRLPRRPRGAVAHDPP